MEYNSKKMIQNVNLALLSCLHLSGFYCFYEKEKGISLPVIFNYKNLPYASSLPLYLSVLAPLSWEANLSPIA